MSEANRRLRRHLGRRQTGRTRKGYAASPRKGDATSVARRSRERLSSVRRQSRQRLRDCTVQKKRPLFAALRCSGPPRGRGSPEPVLTKPAGPLPARAGPLIFPGLIPRVRWGGHRGGHRMASASVPAAAHSSAKGLSNGRTRRSAPTEGRSPQRFVGADLCVGPCPARDSQRQRRSAQRVSGASPGRRVSQGPCVSVPDCREGRPTFSRRRQEVRAGADRPAEAFFSLGPCNRAAVGGSAALRMRHTPCGYGPFSFCQEQKENGGWNDPAIIMAGFPVQWDALGASPRGNGPRRPPVLKTCLI